MASVSPFVKASIEKKTGMSYGDYQAEQAAKSAGFSSAAAQMQNRMMRNQLEEKATRLGVPLSQAYSLAGSDLTNTQALQNAWNQLTGPGPAPAPAQQAAPPQAAAPAPAAPAPTGPSQSDLMVQSLQDSIAAMQQGFMESMQQNAMQFQQMQQAQNERMEALQQMMIQSQASQAERPTVAGVQTAVGQSGTPMQIARRGVSGSFGRRGMRVQNLNV
jgi:hypothetical protein